MQNALIENFLHIDDMLVEPNGKSELKKFAKISKEKEELQNKKEKNKQKKFENVLDFLLLTLYNRSISKS